MQKDTPPTEFERILTEEFKDGAFANLEDIRQDVSELLARDWEGSGLAEELFSRLYDEDEGRFNYFASQDDTEVRMYQGMVRTPSDGAIAVEGLCLRAQVWVDDYHSQPMYYRMPMVGRHNDGTEFVYPEFEDAQIALFKQRFDLVEGLQNEKLLAKDSDLIETVLDEM